MNKRLLVKVARADITDKMNEIVCLTQGVKYLLSVQRMALEEKDTLVLNYFANKAEPSRRHSGHSVTMTHTSHRICGRIRSNGEPDAFITS